MAKDVKKQKKKNKQTHLGFLTLWFPFLIGCLPRMFTTETLTIELPDFPIMFLQGWILQHATIGQMS